MKKVITFLLATAMITACLSGCQSKDKNGDSDVNSNGEKSTKPVTLTAFKNGAASPDKWEWGQDPVSKKITEDTGVTIEVSYAATSDNTEINTMLVSGQDLPDFIITDAHGPVRPLLVEQGFAAPLNELADKYDQSFWDVLPKDMDKVYQEKDGNFYCVVDWYGDENKYDDQILNTRGPISFSIKKEFYDEINRPDISTLDNYANAILQIKEKHPEIKHPIWDQNPTTPWSSSGLLNVLARMYGATNNFFHYDGNTVKMVFMQDYYKEALKAYNNLYRKGLINPEQYAYKQDQIKGTYRSQDLISFVGYYWSLIEGMDILDDVVYESIEFPLPAGKTAEDLKIHDDYFGVGTTGVFVSSDTKYPDRCIQYITYMLGKEGQLMQRYGLEGVTWEEDEQGRPKVNDTMRKAESEGFDILQRDYGVYNYNFSWFTSNWILVYGAHNTYQNYPCMLPDFEIMTPHQQNERFSDLTYSITDPEELALKEQIFDLWTQHVAAICVTDNDQAFEQAYEKFISAMNQAGVDTLESYFQKNADYWREVGIEQQN